MSLAVFSSYSQDTEATAVRAAVKAPRRTSLVADLLQAVQLRDVPGTPVRAAMLRLFWAVMEFYADHRGIEFRPALVTMMIALRATVASGDLEKQRHILAAAADFTEDATASCSWGVQQAIDGAKAALRASWEDESRQRRARRQ